MEYDKRQFEALFRDNYRQMYRVAFSITEDEEDARDAVSQVFAQMWRKQPRIADNSVRGYLLVAVRNQCNSILRHRQLQRAMEEELRSEEITEENTERQELMERLQQVIDENLTGQDRRILALHYDEQMTYGETANALGISIAAVNKHITRSLSKIRQTLKIAKA